MATAVQPADLGMEPPAVLQSVPTLQSLPMLSEPVYLLPLEGRLALWLEFGLRRHGRVAMARLKASARRCGRAIRRRRDDLAPVRSAYGIDLIPNFADKTFRYCLYGTYGRFFADFLRGQDTPFAFLDIGANQGLYSLIAAANPACMQVTAFEPVASTYALLQRNLIANGHHARVRAVNAGVSNRSGPASIAIKPGHSGVATLSRPDAATFGMMESVTLMDGHELAAILPGNEPIIVKIDVEGHETEVIAELVASPLIGRVTAVFYEMDERWADAAAVRELLASVGFTRLRKHGVGRHYDVMAMR